MHVVIAGNQPAHGLWRHELIEQEYVWRRSVSAMWTKSLVSHSAGQFVWQLLAPQTKNPREPKFSRVFGLDNGAQERTRTSTSIRTLAPEASASTNSATWAGVVGPAYKRSRRQRQMKMDQPAWQNPRIIDRGCVVHKLRRVAVEFRTGAQVGAACEQDDQ